MRMRVFVAGVVALAVTGTAYAASAQAGSEDVAGVAPRPVSGTSCPTFPDDNWWHADVRGLPVDARSKAWLSHMSTGVDLHPDFGPSYGDGPNYGIPITVVKHSHPRVRVHFQYASESDRVRYPLGRDTRIEGGRRSSGDRHAIVVDKGSCKLFETYATHRSDGRWYAGSGAVWSLTSDRLRPNGWTSADAAGLPILPGLLRWNEVRHHDIDHAIRFTTDITSQHHLWPARHDAGSRRSRTYPPMGARFRLKASYHPSGFGRNALAVVHAMKKYGLVLADNGSPWYFQGEQNGHWPGRLIAQLKRIPASKFVAVDTSSLKVSGDSGATQ
ncbi:MAG TPA: hypothetical protein VHR35_14930 [Nocardioides sp.]|nr:hypothetical protein [Nocardioides sp.]